MQHLFVVFLVLVGVWFFRRQLRGLVYLSSLLCAAGVMGCGSTPPPSPARTIALEHVREVCWSPPEVDPEDYFVFPDDDGVAVAVSETSLADLGLEIKRVGFIYKYSAAAPAKNLRLLPLNRPEAWCTNVPKPTDEKVLRLLDPCAAPTSEEEARAVAKNLLGQTEVSIRSRFLCGQEPQMAPTPQQVILLRARNEAFQVAYEQARKTAMALTQADAEMQAVINRSDSWLKRKFTSDPGTLEDVQQRLADALNLIEPPPEYGDQILDAIALAGFNAGFDNGKFEVEAKLFAIDAGIVILEFVALEIALGPLGGAKLLASAVSKGGKALATALKRLENIPIFIPGAANGVGAFVRVGKIVKEGSSKALHEAMKAASIRRPEGTDAHHIVALAHKWAQKSRDILAKFGIKVDEAANGVYLPSNMKSPNPNKAIVHATLSNNKVYYQKVEEFLEQATSQSDVRRRLAKIAETLQNGTFYDAIP